MAVINKNKIIPKNLPFKEYVFYALVTNLVLIILSLALNSLLPPEIPLFYGLPTGPEQLAQSWLLPIPAVVSLVIIGVNLLIAKLVKNDFLKKMLALSAIAVTFFSTITIIKIMFLVGNF